VETNKSRQRLVRALRRGTIDCPTDEPARVEAAKARYMGDAPLDLLQLNFAQGHESILMIYLLPVVLDKLSPISVGLFLGWYLMNAVHAWDVLSAWEDTYENLCLLERRWKEMGQTSVAFDPAFSGYRGAMEGAILDNFSRAVAKAFELRRMTGSVERTRSYAVCA
jgi:hypothetical protein